MSEFAVLLEGEDERRRFAAWSVRLPVRDASGATVSEYVIAYREGRCPFLGDDDRCTIYESRPVACRRFECVRHFNQRGVGAHGLFVERDAVVRGMLESL